MLQQPKIGDTVVLKALVTSIDKTGSFDCVKLNFIDCDSPGNFMHSISVNRIQEIIPAPPPKPKIGDRVHVKARDKCYSSSNPGTVSTLLYIHQEEGDVRKWGVIAFKGDIPKCVYFDDLSVAD